MKKLLEAKPEEEKHQAIPFSFACLLTGPRQNQSRDAPFKSGKILVLSTKSFFVRSALWSCTKSNLSFSPEAKKDANHEPKFSFEEVNNDEEDSSGIV